MEIDPFDVLALIGLVVLAWGLAMIHLSLALVVVGALALAFAVLSAR